MKKEIIKPFDLAKAKAGAKLRTRNGYPVEIFKWDTRGKFPIKGMTKEKDYDVSISWTCNGSCCGNEVSSNYDLVIVEEVEEPKFKVNDWITNGEYTYKIVEVINYCYKCNSNKGSTYLEAIDYTDENYHLWTIQDAKIGDVLAFDDGHIILVKESHNSTWGWRLSCWCHLLDGEFEVVEYHTKTEGLHPATNKQRDLLFQKIKEAGYEWNAGKLELKKIKPEFWSDNEGSDIDGFYISVNLHISDLVNVTNNAANHNVFATKKQAKSALAMARISQIMANDIENFGGVITDEEWENDEWKYAIYRDGCSISTTAIMNDYYFLAFHTKKQRDLFLEKYPQLVKDYLMINE